MRLLRAAAVLLCAAGPVCAEDAAAPLYLNPDAPVDQRVADLVGRLTLEEKAALLNHRGPTVERFNIRSDRWNQCLHGVWWDRPTTMFPVSIALAATWDTNLVHQVATVISDEARAIYNGWRRDPKFPGEHKGLIYRAPVINISRNPYWGRINECYGEDPFLTGRIGVAYVRGLQGDDPRHLKLVSTLKHYAVNNVEHGRNVHSARVPERMLREYWLPHFRDCVVEGGAQSVMAAYNAINGVPLHVNRYLLTDILKTEWGFQGFVVSDLGGIRWMVEGHDRNRRTYPDAVAAAMEAGCDFSDREFMENIPVAVREGKLSGARLNDALTRLLRARFRLGEFDPPERVAYSRISPDVIGAPAHRALSLRTAQAAMTLLQNRGGLLPLDRTRVKRLAVLGPHADLFTAGGYSGKAKDPVTPLQGLRNRAGAGVEILYARGCGIVPAKQEGGGREDESASIAAAAEQAKDADAALVFVGTTLDIEAEGRDRTTLKLPGNQEQLVRAVTAANPRTVVVLLNAGPLAIPWAKEHVPALLEAWWAGEEGGNAIADVLFGDANPAGRLPLTFYASDAQVPPQDEYDIRKGFTYLYLRDAPLFPFGHGLSYTRFTYRDLKVAPARVAPGGTVTVSVEVENAGARAGDEVVQLYVRDLDGKMERPAKELRGFQRIHLKPGGRATVTLTVPHEKLARYDETAKAFVVEPGAFEVQVGASSEDIRLRGRFNAVP